MTECVHAKVPFDGATHLRMRDLHEWLGYPEQVWKGNSEGCPYKKETKQ